MNLHLNVLLRLIGPGDIWFKLRRKRASAKPAPALSPSLATTRHPPPYRWVSMATWKQQRNSWAEENVPSRIAKPPPCVLLDQLNMLTSVIRLVKQSVIRDFSVLQRENTHLLYVNTPAGGQSEETGEAGSTQEGEDRSYRSFLCLGGSSISIYLCQRNHLLNLWVI